MSNDKNSAAAENDDQTTVDVEEETEDVHTEDIQKSDDDTEPDSNPKRSPRRVRLPSKVEIIQAVEKQTTESIEVDPLTKEAAQTPKVEDVS